MSLISNDTAINRDDPEVSTIRQNYANRYDSQSGFDTVDEEAQWNDGASDSQDDEVLLNMNPSKFEKPKDHLFIDFFSMYAQKFVDEQS